jgi:hypothetical protein
LELNMRNCPVCNKENKTKLLSMGFTIPDNWTLPSNILWYECNDCHMIYGDGDMNQKMFDDYYRKFYGYGINSTENIERLQSDAKSIAQLNNNNSSIVDFGGAGDDGDSVLIAELKNLGYTNTFMKAVGDQLPDKCDVIYASHVLEHIYDLSKTMESITNAVKEDGLLIIDVPDATGLLNHWKAPILDFTTKHLNHFTLRNLLELGYRYGFENIKVREYRLNNMPSLQVYFRRLNVAKLSKEHIESYSDKIVSKIKEIDFPVNIWGLSDLTWHILSRTNLNILNFIDNDPAYRNATYNGKLILERPTNDAPIIILAQIQKECLVENIKKSGVQNQLIVL